MSLINDMLQDLDARGAPNAMAKSAQVRPVAVAAPARQWSRWLGITLGAMVLGGAVVAGWRWQNPETPPATAMQVLVSPSARVTSVPVTAATSAATTAPPAVQPTRDDNLPSQISQPLLGSLKLDAILSKLPQDRSAATANPSSATSNAVANGESDRATPGPALRISNELERSKLADSKAATNKAPAPTASATVAANSPSVMQIATQSDTPQQRAENEYRKANQFLQQSRSSEAVAALEQALVQDARHHAARQTLASTLISLNRHEEAIKRLQVGLQLDPSQIVFAMMLARLQAERNELTQAIDVMYATLPVAANNAEYQALLAALLQRDKRHKQAVEHYLVALQLRPENGVWWMGMAISLQAENRLPQAFEAYNKAKNSNSLNPQLQTFVEQKMAQMLAGDGATRSNK
ncbi:MAG: tetratricopeptide repeat protein [Burkholderiales bacterium]|nr:tetratricopeptide repeat protein [Burkholderiales bacterium]